ncbi:MAG: DUF502 domain-containing protein [Phycisphaerae bacterium]
MPEQESATRARPRKSRVAATFRALLRTRITAGLLVVLPIWVTILLIKFVFGAMRDSSLWVVEAYLRSPLGAGLLNQWQVAKPTGYNSWPDVDPDFLDPGIEKIPVTEKLDFLEFRLGHPPDMQDFFDMLPETVQWGTAIVSVFLTIIILYAVGLFAANLVGRRVINTFESALDKVPLVKIVYRSTKQILATFAGEQSKEFQRAALVPFPQEKMRAVGFITAIFHDSVTGEELAAVFIPTTPNPTTGYLQILKRRDLVELDWSVEDAVRTIMSGGILRPDFLTILPGARQRDALPEIKQPELQPPTDDAS